MPLAGRTAPLLLAGRPWATRREGSAAKEGRVPAKLAPRRAKRSGWDKALAPSGADASTRAHRLWAPSEAPRRVDAPLPLGGSHKEMAHAHSLAHQTYQQMLFSRGFADILRNLIADCESQAAKRHMNAPFGTPQGATGDGSPLPGAREAGKRLPARGNAIDLGTTKQTKSLQGRPAPKGGKERADMTKKRASRVGDRPAGGGVAAPTRSNFD